MLLGTKASKKKPAEIATNIIYQHSDVRNMK